MMWFFLTAFLFIDRSYLDVGGAKCRTYVNGLDRASFQKKFADFVPEPVF
jgi:hypothetical protein